MQNLTTWVIAANGSIAKFFRVVKFPKLEAIEVLEHPESRLRNQDLVTSKPGRSFESTSSARSAYQPAVNPHHNELEKFARFLGEHLSTAKRNNEFSRLYIMANPGFLGLLRPHLDQATKGAIVAEVGKDVTDQTTDEIENQLSQA